MITVYIDMLFFVNLFMDYLLLWLTGKICGGAKKIRTALGALFGAIYSTAVFFCSMNIVLSLVCMVAAALIMNILAFGIKGKKYFGKHIAVFFGISFLCCGMLIPLFLTGNVFISNGSVYFSKGIRTLFFGAVAVYGAVKLLCRALNGIAVSRVANVNVELWVGEKCISFAAISDTGNSLTEPFTGLPVCIVERRLYAETMGSGKKIYIIPYKTIDNCSGVMTGIKPDRVTITDMDGKKYECKCILAVTDTEIKKNVHGIINPACMKEGECGEYAERAEKIHNEAAK